MQEPVSMLRNERDHISARDIIYTGTYSVRGSRGIYVLEYDRIAGTLEIIQTVDEGDSPNFLALSPDRKSLYAVYAKGIDGDQGSLISFRVDTATAKLTKLNQMSSCGVNPAHVSVDPMGRCVYLSNYDSGSLVIYQLNTDGSLGDVAQVVQHSGSSVNRERQDRAHVHSAVPSADGRFLYVSDLGLDKILVYHMAGSDRLTAELAAEIKIRPGFGPRHFVIHPSQRYAYSLAELSSAVTAFHHDTAGGNLVPKGDITMLPENFQGSNLAADIHISPDGRHLYASNRGHDSLAIYHIDPETGGLAFHVHQHTLGREPRSFMIDRHSEYLIVANEHTDNIVVFKRDELSGKLSADGEQMAIPSPVCVIQL